MYIHKSITIPLKVQGRGYRCREVRAAHETALTPSKRFEQSNWRWKAKPIPKGSQYPAKENCSRCGICDSYFVAHVKEACPFLDDRPDILEIESQVHGRHRNLDDEDELLFGVTEDVFYARAKPRVEGAQWTGIVTRIAMEMLHEGVVDAVVCVQAQENDRLSPKPIVARSVDDIITAKGVKPCLSPNLEVLATVEALNVRKLLFIGVGCHVHALRSIEKYLDVDELYVLGTNCVDNGPREGLDKFLKVASSEPETVTNYEFMSDYKVHLRHDDGSYEKIPYFCLPANDLNDVIAPSCYSCFDYTNAGADIVVGYMGVPPNSQTPMDQHFQYVTVRNAKGRMMLDIVRDMYVETTPPVSGGILPREGLVEQTVIADDAAKMGKGPATGAPRWLGDILAYILTVLGPKGLDFAKYSVEYHYLRNFIHVSRHWNSKKAERHIPEYVQRIVSKYNNDNSISMRASMDAPFPSHGKRRHVSS